MDDSGKLFCLYKEDVEDFLRFIRNSIEHPAKLITDGHPEWQIGAIIFRSFPSLLGSMQQALTEEDEIDEGIAEKLMG